MAATLRREASRHIDILLKDNDEKTVVVFHKYSKMLQKMFGRQGKAGGRRRLPRHLKITSMSIFLGRCLTPRRPVEVSLSCRNVGSCLVPKMWEASSMSRACGWNRLATTRRLHLSHDFRIVWTYQVTFSIPPYTCSSLWKFDR